MNSWELSVIATQNVCKIRKQSTTSGSSRIQQDKQNFSIKILNKLHLPFCDLMTKTQRSPVLLAEYMIK